MGSDNVLKEFERALELQRGGQIEIFSLFVGTHVDGNLKPFNGFADTWPDHSSSSLPQKKISETMAEIFAFPGIHIDPNDITPKLEMVRERFGLTVWPKYRSYWQELSKIDKARQDHLAKTVGYQANPDKWLEIDLNDYDYDCRSMRAAVGRVTAKNNEEEGKLFVMVQGFDFVMFWSSSDLEHIASGLEQDLFHEKKYERPEGVNPAFVRVSWVRKPSESETTTTTRQIIGVEIAIKPSHSEIPHINRVYFDSKQMKKLSTELISDIIIREKRPYNLNDTASSTNIINDFSYSPYEVPNIVYTKGSFLPDPKDNILFARKDFKTEGSKIIRIKQNGNVLANPSNRRDGDIFEISFNVLNLIENKSVCILEMKADWQYEDLTGKLKQEDVSWESVPENNIYFVSGKLPLTIQGDGMSDKIVVRVVVPAPDRTDCGSSFNFQRSWLARIAPVNIRLRFEDKTGEESTQVFQFCNPGVPLTEPSRDDVMFLFADDLRRYERYAIRCTWQTKEFEYLKEPDRKVFEVRAPGRCFNMSVDDMRYYVYLSSKNSEQTEIEWATSTEDDFSWKAYLLIDRLCKRVYAVKFVLQTPHTMSIGYFKIPLYGEISEPFALSYSKEISPESILEQFNPVEVVGVELSEKSNNNNDNNSVVVGNQKVENQTISSVTQEIQSVVQSLTIKEDPNVLFSEIKSHLDQKFDLLNEKLRVLSTQK
eukprot:c19296_g2_i1.p1 GENE.c19296_g2_i1~~c19296_g2_i1.p1  ORF type:complete len:805 (+),score=333.77 c19296_g2_i1:286-2415(+)